jgi:steroid delta-isomerase-like uncharacterized protein
MMSIQRLISVLVLTSLSSACTDSAETQLDTHNASDAATHASANPGEAPVVDHINVMLQRIAANNAQDWDTWESLHTEDAVRTAPGLPGPLMGAAALRAGIEELFTTFPDYHLELVDAFGQGDQLVARIHTRATMLGPLQLGDTSVPATEKAFEQDWVALLRFESGKIASINEFYDNYEILVQLGLSE